MTTDVLIDVKNLRKTFDNGAFVALSDVSAQIHRGEVVVVIGPSGSGKSTFLRCLNLLEHPTGGQIIFDGVDITDPSVNINIHRQRMGMVFQHFNLFPNMTILRNMTLAPMKLLHKSRAEAEKKAMQLLERVHGGQGVVVANDANECRARMLINQTSRLLSPRLAITSHLGQEYPTLPLSFDKVLCDVPCSGDGTLVRAAPLADA